MRAFRNRRVSVLATVTGVGVGIAGVVLFARFGPPVGPESYDPAEAANASSVAGDPRKPPAGMPSLPFPSLPGGRPGSSSSSPSGAPTVDAPTENLRKVVAALRFTYKSTTGVLIVPPGLNLTGTVEISMLWDEGSARPTRATQNYNNATGNRSLFLFPTVDGRTRPVANVLSLREPGVEGAYTAVRSNVTIEPLYDVSVSPLTFTLEDDCDLAGDSEMLIRWRSPDGRLGQFEVSMSEGQLRTAVDFKQTYQEAGRSTNLQEPTVIYFEDDGAFGGDFFGYPTASRPPLVLGKDLVVDRYGYAQNDVQCGARIKYSITYQLREYLYLE
jgi:hypothetical protein